ncbi:hypothetical protein M9Y10_012778 [Tritrichomonas musculus]|uniref:Uncharacterized protein n=1 Tax=Tritrichomonas musculus TaxID=1915356 RepID=A0ABR2IDE1_9EUKA
MKNKIILYVNDSHSNWIPATDQTQYIRDRTNQKIKELGKKYYYIKSLFDSMGLQRDNLFYLARKLETQYEERKPGIHIPASCKRMKDAIYTWYADNFYTEIVSNNPEIMIQLQEIRSPHRNSSISKLSDKSFTQKKKTPNQNKKNQKTARITQVISKTIIEVQDNPITENTDYEYKSFLNLQVNEEIDNLDFSNISNDKEYDKDSSCSNPNFNIDLLNF